MKQLFKISILIFISCFIFSAGFSFHRKPAKILIYSKTTGFRHKSIEAGIAALKKLGERDGYLVDATEDAAVFNAKSLKKYKAVVFLSPTGNDILNEDQKSAFQKFLRKGHGFVGIHAATDCLYNWDWYGKMVGAYFKNHPAIQAATLKVTDSSHVSTAFLPTRHSRKDEWYNFKSLNPSVKMLITVDETSYKGGANGQEHPISWYHTFEGARVFYTALGHTEESFTSDEYFLKHLAGGLKYAIGLE